MNSKIIKRIVQSGQGYLTWRKITKSITDRDVVLVMPEDCDELNYYSLLYIDRYIKKNQKRNCVIVTNNKKVLTHCKDISNTVTEIFQVNSKKINNLIQFYCLYQFDTRIMFASLSKPNGRNAERILNKNGVSIEDIVSIGIFNLDGIISNNEMSLSQKNAKKIFIKEA